jgi:O-antigen ligase
MRYTGLLGNANVLAINFTLAAIAVWLEGARFPLVLRVLSFLSANYGIFLSGSRKGLLLGVALLLLSIKHITDRLSLLKRGFLLGSLMVATILFYQYFDSILSFLRVNIVSIRRLGGALSGTNSSFLIRKSMIEDGYSIWLNSPLFGEGFGYFASTNIYATYSHNNYIELLVSGGIVAFFLYYTLYLVILYKAFRNQRCELFGFFVIVCILLVVDAAVVSIVGRSYMLFVVLLLAHCTEKPKTYGPVSLLSGQ